MRIQFKYKNHHGQIEDRDVDVVRLAFDYQNHSDFGYQPGWYLGGWDYSRGRNGDEFRNFYLSHIILPDQNEVRDKFFSLIYLDQESAK